MFKLNDFQIKFEALKAFKKPGKSFFCTKRADERKFGLLNDFPFSKRETSLCLL